MRDRVMERATLAAKRDFDLLPRSAEIAVQPALRCDLGALAHMANRLVPGVQITEPDLERYYTFDPGSILSKRHVLHGAVHGDDVGIRFQDGSRHPQGMLVEILGQSADRLQLLKGNQTEQAGERKDGAKPRQEAGQQTCIC